MRWHGEGIVAGTLYHIVVVSVTGLTIWRCRRMDARYSQPQSTDALNRRVAAAPAVVLSRCNSTHSRQVRVGTVAPDRICKVLDHDDHQRRSQNTQTTASADSKSHFSALCKYELWKVCVSTKNYIASELFPGMLSGASEAHDATLIAQLNVKDHFMECSTQKPPDKNTHHVKSKLDISSTNLLIGQQSMQESLTSRDYWWVNVHFPISFRSETSPTSNLMQ